MAIAPWQVDLGHTWRAMMFCPEFLWDTAGINGFFGFSMASSALSIRCSFLAFLNRTYVPGAAGIR